MDKRRFHQCYRSLRSDPKLDKEPRKPKRTPSLNKMYLETKISMLEIVQEGLQLKLDMQNVKEEFIGLLEGYHNYENYDQFDHLFEAEMFEGDHRVPPLESRQTHQQSYHDPKQEQYNRPVADPRARVKALYEARKARMHARRDKLDTQPSTSFSKPHSWQGIQYSYPHPEDEQRFDSQRMQTPVLSVCSESDKDYDYYDYEDRNNNTPTKSPKDKNYHEQSSLSSNDPPYINMLSSISEENTSSSRNSSSNNPNSSQSFDSEVDTPKIPPRCPLIPKNRYKEYLSKKAVPKPAWQDLGEYVTLKAPNQSIVSFSDSNMCPPPSMLQPDMMTQSFGGSMFSVVGSESQILKKDNDTYAKESSVRYAKSNVISELYTSQKRERSNLDISYISNISGASSPGGTTPGLSESSGDYPLHSTMIGASIHSPVLPLSLSETDEDSLMNRTDDTLETIDTLDGDGKIPHDVRTTVSEPSAILRAPNTSQVRRFVQPKAYDDSYINSQMDTKTLPKTPNNPIPSSRHLKNSNPKQTRIPQLCSEHGLHLTYGGPCMFNDSFDMLGSSEESDLDFSSVNFNSENGSKLGSKRSSVASKRSSVASKISSKRSSVIHHNSIADTDCDSSYLSECVDDTHFTNDFSEAENYTALYDSRNGRMKMLRRQTGQGNIKRHKKPVGLSESDFLHDVTDRHLSLQATRSSMPDIYNLSPTSSLSSGEREEYINQHESSLHDSTLKSHFDQSSYNSDEDNNSNSMSHNETVVSCDHRSNYCRDEIDSRSEQRPVSLCTSTTGTTTTDESPESNGGMTVPVNSPNITDSGGSSSRPTTDTYDYVDVPINIPKVAELLKNKLSLQQQQHQHQHQLMLQQQSRSMQSIPNSHSKKIYAASCAESHHSHRSYQSQAKTAYSDPILNDPVSRDETKKYKKVQKYPRSQDSGFATHESGRSHYMPKTRAHSYDALQYDQPFVQYDQPFVHNHHLHSKQRGHIAISNPQGFTRTVVQHSAVARNLNKDRKKALAKKLKQFNNNFYGSNGNPQIKTLAHF